ncbi:PAS domain-containing protein [Caulobacter sp. KR2-114]|uniref:PAS domain-containing protein n=1 Tax=Caulobacter sp. KR2-114 TaxID=3400912 RepID=UPI003C05B826
MRWTKASCLSQLAEHLPMPCWISDGDGRIVWVNDAWLNYIGKDPDTLSREGLAIIHDPAVLPAVRRKWRETLAAGEADEMVFPLKGRDGAFRPFHTRVVPLRDAEGRIRRWFGTNIDVSREAEAELRASRTEATLRENEARLRLATNAAGVGVWEWRLDTGEMIYSPRAKEICGFDADASVTYEMVAAVTHPDDFPRTSAQAQRALDPAVREAAPYEYRIVRPDGDVRWVTAVGEAVFEADEAGKPVARRSVGVLIDITERKLADDAVRNSEQQLQMALRAGRMVAWRTETDGRLAPSRELKLLAGLPPDAKPTFASLSANYLPGELERIQLAADAARAKGQRFFEIEYRYRLPDGQVRWFNARAEAQVGEAGEPGGAIGVVMDITDRKEDEERLRFLAREVDHRANNLLAVVEGLVALSRGKDADELREVLRGRVHALARAHQLLAETRWEGAEVRRLVEEELSPYGLGDPARVRLEGSDRRLRPATAQALAMVLHELATNAVKYGALSTLHGRVEVSWQAGPDGDFELKGGGGGGGGGLTARASGTGDLRDRARLRRTRGMRSALGLAAGGADLPAAGFRAAG